MQKFIFDLDGTITSEETLPIIAKHFGIEDEICRITEQTIKGNIPFVESFIQRVFVLGRFPIDEIDALLENVKVYPQICDFIRRHADDCLIATGNLDCWVNKLIGRIGCRAVCSEGIIEANKVVKLTKILKKENVVDHLQKEGYRVIFIGDGNNDMEAMRMADIAIASGLTHQPAQGVLTVADYAVFCEEALCRQLNQLY